MRAAALLASLLALPALAGCLADTLPDDEVVVHGGGDVPRDFGAPLPRFEQVFVGDGLGNEPTIGVTPEGNAFYASLSPGNAGLATMVFRSQDDGATWEDVTPSLLDSGLPITEPAISQDPYIYVDPDTGRIFSIDLYVGCSWLIMSEDEGATWSRNPLACGVPVNDHQTLFTGPAPDQPGSTPVLGDYPNKVFYCFNQFIANAYCTASGDGGQTFLPAAPAYLTPEGDGRFLPTTDCGFSAHGHGEVSRGGDGTVYLPHVYCDEILLATSRDGGATWEDIVVDEATGSSPDYIDNHEASVAVDAAGHVYVFWVGPDAMPRLKVSTDQARTFGPTLSVGHPDVTYARYPAIVAGDEGRIAIHYWGTEDAKANAPDMTNGTWNAYVGVMLDAVVDGRPNDDPVIATTTINDPADPLKRGPCVERCGDGGSALVYDFMDIQIDPVDGQIWVASADVCHDLCATDASVEPAHMFNRASVGVQVSGVTLRESADDGWDLRRTA